MRFRQNACLEYNKAGCEWRGPTRYLKRQGVQVSENFRKTTRFAKRSSTARQNRSWEYSNFYGGKGGQGGKGGKGGQS